MAQYSQRAVTTPGQKKEILTGVVSLGAAGALAAGQGNQEGFTIAKTGSEVGRYTVTLAAAYTGFSFASMVVEGTADAAAAAAKGQVAMLRGVNAATKTAFFQLITPSLAAGASVDVEAEDNAKLRILIVANKGFI